MKIMDWNKEENTSRLIQLLECHQRAEIGIAPQPKAEISYGVTEKELYLGGLTASIFMNTMHIGLLAVDPQYRGQGVGAKLLRQAETAAAKADCRYITIHTQDYQALTYYQQKGYQVFGQLPDMPFEGTTKYYLVKKIKE